MDQKCAHIYTKKYEEKKNRILHKSGTTSKRDLILSGFHVVLFTMNSKQRGWNIMDLVDLLCHVLTRIMLCRGPSLQMKKKKSAISDNLFMIL